MAGTVRLDRKRWLGFRWQRHGLAGGAGSAGSAGKDVLDDLLLLGIQGSRQAGAEQSLRQRTSRIGNTSVRAAIGPAGPLVSMWSVRGAPHTHRVTHLDLVRDALAPQESGEGGAGYVAAVEEVATALRVVVAGPTSKATASREVADRVSGKLVQWCPRCQARHVPDGMFRAAGRQAQVVLGPEERRATMLYPTPEQRQVRVDHPRREFLSAYFRVNGPTSRTLLRDWLESDTGTVAGVWQELAPMAQVQVDNRRCDLPEALVDEVRRAPAPSGVVLVPPHDPYLRQVDRTLLVPDRAQRNGVWRALSGPGALLIDGEVAGTWRYRRTDRELTVTPFGSVPPGQRRQVADSAARVAEATGDDQPAVSWT